MSGISYSEDSDAMRHAQGSQEHQKPHPCQPRCYQNPSKGAIRRSAPGCVQVERSSLGVRATGHAGSPMKNQYPWTQLRQLAWILLTLPQ